MLVLHAVGPDRSVGDLQAVLAIHVDDLKMTGDKQTLLKIVARIEHTFGKLILQWHRFTNCGLRHIQDPTTFECTLDQIEYIAALKTIEHFEIRSAARSGDTVVVTREVFEMFRSLRGAVAYALMTRADAAVYMVALQRKQPETQRYNT